MEKEDNFSNSNEPKQIETVAASFRNLSTKDPIKNSVIYFWESHTKNPDDKKRTQATTDLIYKKFDMASCEKYEVRTGYLSLYNYLLKPREESSIYELEAAIEKGEEEQSDWIKRCDPKLVGFIQKNWQDCISKNKNPHFENCRKLLTEHINADDEFETAFSESVNNFVSKRAVNAVNSKSYLIEENAWILTLPLLHPDKQIYIIHVGNVTESTLILFSRFSYLRDSARLLLPTLCNERFNCMADFLMEYKNKKNYGYSHPVDDDKTVSNFIPLNEEQPTTDNLLKMLLDERSEKELLSSVISKIPGHIYWLSKDGIYLGCNDLQAQRLGLSSRHDIVGKTNYDLLPEAEARKHNNINKMVMERGIVYSGEETSTMQGGKHSYLSRKAPLFNSSHTKVVGLLGISIDITDRIKADEERKKTKDLKFQNKLQQIRIQDQEEFRNFIARMAHDIVSPLISLNFIMKTCRDIPEEQRANLRNAITDINNIANALLGRYKQDEQNSAAMEMQHILVPLALLETVYQKKREYHDRNVDIRYTPDASFNFTFIEGDQSNFRRMLSNLINNSVEAFEDKSGAVDISLQVKDNRVFIKISDNGRGMSKEMTQRILRNESVGTTKTFGYGIGLDQVRNTLELYKGKMSVVSKEGVGTEITLIFPLSQTPNWIVDKLVLQKGNILVILDDDRSMEDVWKNLLKDHMNEVDFKFFPKMNEAADFINSSFEKERILLLSDYDLKDKNTGLHFILENNMKEQAMIMTSIHNDKIIHDLIISSGVKILPKQFLNDIVLTVE